MEYDDVIQQATGRILTFLKDYTLSDQIYLLSEIAGQLEVEARARIQEEYGCQTNYNE